MGVSMKNYLSFFVFFGFLLCSFAGSTEEALLPADQLLESYKTAKNENERYQQLSTLSKKVILIAKAADTKQYIQVISDMVSLSKSVGDADWVANKGNQLIQAVSENKFQLLIQEYTMVPVEQSLQDDLLYYIAKCTEGFQHVYLSKQVNPYLLDIKDMKVLSGVYLYFEKMQQVLSQSADYIQRDVENILHSIGFLYCLKYQQLTNEELGAWLPRMSSEGMQKLLTAIDNDILNVANGKPVVLEKSIFVDKILYQILFDRYQHDPFNDWQYIKPLKSIIAAIFKYQQLDWNIPTQDIQFLIDHLSPMAFVNFCNELGGFIVQKKLVSQDLALRLLKTYDLLNETLKQENYLYDATTFINAYTILKKSIQPKGELEGAYHLAGVSFQEVIIAFNNMTDIVAGARTENHFVNLAFDYFQYDDETGYFVGRTSAGPSQFVMRFKLQGHGKLHICINEECGTGTRYYQFPEYLSLLNQNKNLILPGLYKGKVRFEDGSQNEVRLLVSSVGGYLVGNLDFANHNHLGFDKGINDNSDGVLYLAGRVSAVPTIHVLRAVLDSKNQLSGVWFATSKAKIGKFILVKQKL